MRRLPPVAVHQTRAQGWVLPFRSISSSKLRLLSFNRAATNGPCWEVAGASVDLYIQQANHLTTQSGAYIDQVTQGGPAAQAGLHGSTGQTTVNGYTVPTRGDVIVAVNGQPVNTYDELLAQIDQYKPGSTISLTVVRNGQQQQVQVTLGTRPANTQTGNPTAQPPVQ